MERGANIRSGARMLVEEHVFPGDLDIIEDHQRIDFVEAIRKRIVVRRLASRETRAADVLHPRLAHLDNEPDRIG